MVTQDLMTELLALSPAERGRIVRELILSLEQEEFEDPAEVEQAWAIELERRAAMVETDKSVRDASEVCDELDARRRSKG